MAGRIRSIHPGQPTDEAFVSCGPWARLLSIFVRNEADDHGVFEWKPLQLKMRVFPADPVNVAELLSELEATGQVAHYQIDGKRYGIIRNFLKYQRVRRPSYVHPLPLPDQVPAAFLIVPAFVGNDEPSSDDPPDSDGREPAEVGGMREEGGKEGSVASATGGEPPPEPVTDLKSMVFGSALRWWKANSSKTEDALRRWLGQCCAKYGDGNVIMATAALQSRPPPVDPFAAMKAELERMVGNGKRVNGKEPAGHQRDRRRSALVAAALALDVEPDIPGPRANGRDPDGHDGGGEILGPGRPEDGRRVA